MSNSTNSMDDIGASSSTNHLTSANGFRQRHGAVKGSSREESRDRRRRDGRAKTSRPRRLGDFLGSRWDIVREAHVKEGFRRFGDHCARNQVGFFAQASARPDLLCDFPQIRTLLIDCLVMTNLFYPALAVWLQKKFPPLHPPSPPSHNTHRIHAQGQSGPSRRVQKEHPLSLLSTPVLDSFFPYPPPLLPRLTWAGWWGRDKGQRGHEGWTVVRVPETDVEPGGGGDEVRIMRLGWADVGDVLDHEVQADARAWAERDHVLLRLVRSTAEGWERDHPSTGASCVRELSPASSSGQETTSTGPCHIISPHSGPDDGDITPLGYLSTSSGHPSANGSETPDTVPIGWRPNAGNIYHSVAALFRVPRSSSMAFEDSWLEVMDEITMDCEGEVFLEAQGPQGGAGDQTGKWLLSVRFLLFVPAVQCNSDS